MIFKDQYDKSIWQKTVFCTCVLITALASSWAMFTDIEFSSVEVFITGDHLRRGLIAVCVLIYLFRLMITVWVFQKRQWTWQETVIISTAMSLAIYAFISVGRNNTKAVEIVEIVGVALYLFGSYVNTQAEYSRHVWKLNPENKGKLYTGGLFRFAMHINYLGDLILFAGLALLTHFSLLVIPSLMFVNFAFNIIPSLDQYLEKKYSDQFVTYARETKKLIPWQYLRQII